MHYARFLKPVTYLLELAKLGTDFWVVVTQDGLLHGVRYELNIVGGYANNVATCCPWSYGRNGEAVRLERGIPTCIACAVSPYGAKR